MQREIRGIRRGECTLIPVRLDGSPLPPELAVDNALEMPAHLMWLGRVSELVRNGKMSHAAAVAQLEEEMKRDGLDLTPAQRRRATAYARRVSSSAGVVSGMIASMLWWLRRSGQAVTNAPVLATLLLLGSGAYALDKIQTSPNAPGSSAMPDSQLRPDTESVCAELRSCTSGLTRHEERAPRDPPLVPGLAAMPGQLKALVDAQQGLEKRQVALAAAQDGFASKLDGLGRCVAPPAASGLPRSTPVEEAPLPPLTTNRLEPSAILRARTLRPVTELPVAAQAPSLEAAPEQLR